MPDEDYPEIINFTDNNFSTEIVCNLIKTFKIKLTKLILRGNKLCLDGAKEFSTKITKLNNKMKLIHLDLRNTKLGDKGGSILIEKLSHLKYLEHLNLSDNQLSTMSGQALTEYFDSQN